MRLSISLREFHPMVRALLTGAFLSRFALSMTTPFLTIYLIRHTSMSIATVGFVVGAAFVCGMFGGFIASALTDYFGRNTIMMGALYLWVVIFFGFSLTHSTYLLIIFTLLNGTCRSVYEPVSQVLLGDLTPKEQRYKVFSLRYTVANAGYSVGPIVGAWLGLTGGSGAFGFTGCVFLLYSILLQWTVLRTQIPADSGDAPVARTNSFRTVLKVIAADRSLCFFLLGGIVARSTYEQINGNLSLQFQQHIVHGLQLFATTLSVNAIVVVLCQVPISKWAEKRPLFHSIVLGNLSFAVGFVLLAFARNWVLGIVGVVIFTLGEILTFPAGMLFIDKLAPDNMRGAYYGTKNVLDLGKFFGPWFGGIVMTVWGGTMLFLVTAAVVMASTVFYSIGLTYFQSRQQQRVAA